MGFIVVFGIVAVFVFLMEAASANFGTKTSVGDKAFYIALVLIGFSFIWAIILL